MVKRTKRSPVLLIGQAELARYLELKADLAGMMQVVKAERARLLGLIDDGVPVEPGPLGVRVRRGHEQRVSRRSLIEALGEDGYDELRRMLVPRDITYLFVTERPDVVDPFATEGSDVSPRLPILPDRTSARSGRSRGR